MSAVLALQVPPFSGVFFSHSTAGRRVNSERTRNGNFPSARNSTRNLKRAEVGQSQRAEQSGASIISEHSEPVP